MQLFKTIICSVPIIAVVSRFIIAILTFFSVFPLCGLSHLLIAANKLVIGL
jgi:hypothetical protein